ncbi:MAG: DUF2075 domain-containing protein [Candidatus Saccharibacteria bacterium]|nr:DUF2075 domain-containing protein [Candidatus Saccharibacteria bacterium]
MSSFRIEKYSFNQAAVATLSKDKEKNWPVVYQIRNSGEIYIGETTNLKNRMRQHLDSEEKANLRGGVFNVVFDDTFNKSAALDLESYLIRYFSGDGHYKVLNRNDGMLDRDYYDRDNYRKLFKDIWERLRELKIADKTIVEIENSELFKFSPYKNLRFEQLDVVTKILLNIDGAIQQNNKSLSIIGGDAGTGKTIVIMYLAKLLADLQTFDGDEEDIDDESNFSDFFTNKTLNDRFKNKKIALVIPQTSLRGRVESILKNSGLGDADFQIFSPIAFGKQDNDFDITLVDEAHLLKIGGYNQQGQTLQTVKDINKKLFGDTEPHSELDWIMKKSKNVVMVYSEKQRVRPGNINFKDDLQKYYIPFGGREYKLTDQIRSDGGEKYIQYIDYIFSKSFHPAQKETFKNFEAKLFTDFRQFVDAIHQKEEEYGLSRLVAGFAWKWKSKEDKSAYDIEIDDVKLRWNSTLVNFLGSEKSKEEVGSIYTVQGDDLNYAGVIIGKDLIRRKGRLMFNKEAYADIGALKRNRRQVSNGEVLDDDYFLEQVLQVYKVLLSRAMKGVYIYVCDDELRKYLSKYFDVI